MDEYIFKSTTNDKLVFVDFIKFINEQNKIFTKLINNPNNYTI